MPQEEQCVHSGHVTVSASSRALPMLPNQRCIFLCLPPTGCVIEMPLYRPLPTASPSATLEGLPGLN